ncbi:MULTISPECIES: hypothetical protein [unclassified Ruminococcus]|uniref:hypothetical protein n=1 Tax=unclassified Ruminococcus TaxID=2608920 RepID=UPI00210BDD40|nr:MULTISPECIES: hypothetical protein [unclassified Ruminococcus]MCQ4021601.1 hypothetical protein [Ruminococcus sp. zg-924]MCQ4114046.1 hypothetical protein [Ruminococcus sp. zg-921]
MERIIDYIGDVKPRGTFETAEMLFYDDILALQDGREYGYVDEDWEDEYDDDEYDDWLENM